MLFLESGDGSFEILKETADDFDQQASEGEQTFTCIPVIWTHYFL